MKDEIKSLLEKLDIEYRWVEHPAVYTVAESKLQLADKVPVKNLLLQEKGKGHKVLVIMSGDERLDIRYISKKLNTKKLQFASPGVLMKTFSVSPGAVSLFGLLYQGAENVAVVLDERLVGEKEVGFHPNINTETVFVPGNEIERIIVATGHSCELLKF